jgi:hypothetical protein
MTDQHETILPEADPNAPTPSDPPDVKEAKVWQATLQNGLVVGFVGAGWLMGKIGTELAIPILLGVAGLISLPAFFGKKPGSIGVLGLAAKPVVVITGLLHKGSTLLSLLLVLGGCGLLGDERAATVHMQALEAADGLDGAARELNEAGPWISFYCAQRGESDPLCHTGRIGYQVSALSIEVARQAVKAYNDTGAGYEAVQRAIAQLKRDLEDVRTTVDKAKGLSDGILGNPVRAGGAAAPSGTPTQEPSAAGTGEGQPAAAAQGAGP